MKDFWESKEIRERVIVENELAFAFPTNIPIVPGHTLICPKRRVALLDEVSTEEWLAMMEMRKKLKKAMKKAFGAEGFNYAWNEGEAAGQSVPHVHLHMLPRKKGDAGVYGYEPRKFLYRPGSRVESPQKKLVEVAESIRLGL